jgi:hypothetical protein
MFVDQMYNKNIMFNDIKLFFLYIFFFHTKNNFYLFIIMYF